jgi:hypothetical protein
MFRFLLVSVADPANCKLKEKLRRRRRVSVARPRRTPLFQQAHGGGLFDLCTVSVGYWFDIQ